MNQRLQRLREALKLEWGELAEYLGMSRSMLDFVRKGQRNLSFPAIRRLEEAERSCGLMPSQHGASGVATKAEEAHKPLAIKKGELPSQHPSTATPISSGVMLIPVFGMAQALGCRIHHGDIVPSNISDLPTVPVLADGKTYAAFKVEGDSMAPRLMDGMIVLCDVHREPTNKCVVVCKWDDTVTVKRYRRSGDKVFLTSDNPDSGEDYEIHAREIAWCLRVVRALMEM